MPTAKLLLLVTGASASTLHLTGTDSRILFGNRATLSAECGDPSVMKANSVFMAPTMFGDVYSVDEMNVTVHLRGVQLSCSEAAFDEPCVANPSFMPPRFYCNYNGTGQMQVAGPFYAERHPDVAEDGSTVGMHVLVRCPFSWEVVEHINAEATSDGPQSFQLLLSYANHLRPLTTSPRGRLIPFTGDALGDVVSMASIATRPSSPPPPLPEAPPPPPEAPPPPAIPACWQFGGTTDTTVSGTLTLDTDANANGFFYNSLTVPSGATITATGANSLKIFVSTTLTIAGMLNISGLRGGNAGSDSPGAGGGAGGGALGIAAKKIIISGAVHADGGNGGDAGGPGQGGFASASDYGDGSGGVGRAGGHNGGSGGTSSQAGNAGSGPGASAGSAFSSSVPPGAGGAGYALAGTDGYSEGGDGGGRQPGGSAYGNAQLSTGLLGGSGAGGGGNDGDNEEGAGGGGSGGSIWLLAETIQISGTVSAVGGLGGTDDYYFSSGDARESSHNGGPGSVGRIRFDYQSLIGTSTPTPGHADTDSTCAADTTDARLASW